MLALHLLALLPLASALAITSPNPLSVAKRAVTYHTYTDSKLGNSDYCGEHYPDTTTNMNSPLATDCNAIADAYTDFKDSPTSAKKGFWTVEKSDFAASPDGFVTLAASGTCAFKIRLTNDLGLVYFGANDLRFYMRWALLKVHIDRLGKVESLGSVSCYANAPGLFSDLQYSVTRA